MPTAITNLRIAASGSSNHALRDDAGHPGLLDSQPPRPLDPPAQPATTS
jgi:hypothetical protein